jgi:hypothetical protein
VSISCLIPISYPMLWADSTHPGDDPYHFGHISMKKMYRQRPIFQISFPLPQNQYNFGERMYDELTSHAHTKHRRIFLSSYKLTNQHHIYNRISSFLGRTRRGYFSRWSFVVRWTLPSPIFMYCHCAPHRYVTKQIWSSEVVLKNLSKCLQKASLFVSLIENEWFMEVCQCSEYFSWNSWKFGQKNVEATIFWSRPVIWS